MEVIQASSVNFGHLGGEGVRQRSKLKPSLAKVKTSSVDKYTEGNNPFLILELRVK